MERSACSFKEEPNKGTWTAEEDQVLKSYIEANGAGNWNNLPMRAGLKRHGKSCRLRWLNYLRPDIKRGNISEDEEDLILKLHSLLGNRWSLIAGRLPGRTDNEIKNYWNTTLAKKARLISHSGSSKQKSHDPTKLSWLRKSSAAAVSQPQVIRTKATRLTRTTFPSHPLRILIDDYSTTKTLSEVRVPQTQLASSLHEDAVDTEVHFQGTDIDTMNSGGNIFQAIAGEDENANKGDYDIPFDHDEGLLNDWIENDCYDIENYVFSLDLDPWSVLRDSACADICQCIESQVILSNRDTYM